MRGQKLLVIFAVVICAGSPVGWSLLEHQKSASFVKARVAPLVSYPFPEHDVQPGPAKFHCF